MELDEPLLLPGDCLQAMQYLPDNSVDMVLTDPPYFKVKGEEWDRQWDKPTEFLAWLDECSEQWARLLKPNGSLYCFASPPQMSARVEVLLSERLNVLNHIVWYKAPDLSSHSNCAAHRSEKSALRSYFPETERIIFCEHYGADSAAKGEDGYAAKCDELRGFLFEPLRAYLTGEFKRAGMLNTAGKIAANVACGFSASSGGMASRHYFSESQWCLPTPEHYRALRGLLNLNRGEYLTREYEDLRREYEDLRREYEDLRRPFSVSADVPYTDVWTFDTVRPYKGKHVCEKPGDMLERIVNASTREGAVVLDAFMGSGATGVACVNTGRKFIGIEKDNKWYERAAKRIAAARFDKDGTIG